MPRSCSGLGRRVASEEKEVVMAYTSHGIHIPGTPTEEKPPKWRHGGTVNDCKTCNAEAWLDYFKSKEKV